ncbi:hypothetical protein [Schaalia canis]|uniref:Uncharacterized protein n=1 Tax=Schaalia canis TaxID=100469 RepID=A0A3P1SHK2_9ACTO|nr:hypothetical protein [Schaalia canis]RRC96516.1 hypothetical protein EII11_02465 [Schaalia canis]
MTLDGFLAAFATRLHSLVILVASSYVACTFWAIYQGNTQGYTLVLNFLEEVRLNGISDYLAMQITKLNPEGTEGTNYFVQTLLLVWLIVSLLQLIGAYSEGPSADILPRSAIAAAFFWCLLADLFYDQAFGGLHTNILLIAIAIIAYRNRGFKREFFLPPLMAVIAILISPFYALLALPVWLSSENIDTKNTTLNRQLIAEVRYLREAIEERLAPLN